MSGIERGDPYSDNEIVTECCLRGTRKTIAKHLMESYRNKAHASMSRYIDIEKLKSFKQNIGNGSLIDHFYRSVALSLSEKRELNAIYDGEVYKKFKNINLSIAVDAPKGLITPVLRNADKLQLDDFIEERKRIIAIVKEWKHKLYDIVGGTFTVSNLGNYGIDFLTPIINPPQVAIMGIGRACNLSVSWDDLESVRARLLMPVTISYDHCIIDGVCVSEFLQILQDKTNHPECLWDNLQQK
jgi:pyruvate/2-oxoglutarate dehydrogenase complex dihydrolipoamide acyltransferase (E2) component